MWLVTSHFRHVFVDGHVLPVAWEFILSWFCGFNIPIMREVWSKTYTWFFRALVCLAQRQSKRLYGCWVHHAKWDDGTRKSFLCKSREDSECFVAKNDKLAILCGGWGSEYTKYLWWDMEKTSLVQFPQEFLGTVLFSERVIKRIYSSVFFFSFYFSITMNSFLTGIIVHYSSLYSSQVGLSWVLPNGQQLQPPCMHS